MVISKRKARKKLDSIFWEVRREIINHPKSFKKIIDVPNGKRLIRYAKKTNTVIWKLYEFGYLVEIW